MVCKDFRQILDIIQTLSIVHLQLAVKRDYLKGTHFPNKHPGIPYRERGEQTIFFGFSQLTRPKPAEVGAKQETFHEEAEELPHAVEEVMDRKKSEMSTRHKIIIFLMPSLKHNQ